MGEMIYASEARVGEKLKWHGVSGSFDGVEVLVVERDKYGNPWGKYLTFPARPERVGYKFELNRSAAKWERVEDPFVVFVREVLENHADDRSTGG